MHTVLQRLCFDGFHFSAFTDDVLQLRSHFHDFIYTDSSAKACAVAFCTAAWLINCQIFLRLTHQHFKVFGIGLLCPLTIRTKAAHQSLCNNTNRSVCNQVRFNSHIHQTGNRAGCGVRMQRGYHKVTCDGCLYSDGCRLLITDFSDHNDVRILSQDGTQCRCKGQIRFIVDLHLVDSVNICFHRIFYGDDVYIFFI